MLTALVADDHPVSLEFMRMALATHGLEPTLVSNGAQAMIALERARYDILFIDWLMPGMSGVDVVRQVRSNHTANPPHVIMLTAKSADEDLVTAFEAGVDDFIRKPINGLELKARLSAALRIIAARRNLSDRLDEIKELHRQLEASIITDPLTELPNRLAVMRKCAQILQHSAASILRPSPSRTGGRTALSVALVDIDDFKSLNALLGEPRSDAILKSVAKTLRETIRPSDIVARTGGDEFVILFPDTDAIEAAAIIDLCHRRIADTRRLDDGHDVHLSACTGIAMTSATLNTAENLTQAAHDALGIARKRGGSQIATTEDHRYRMAAGR